MVPQTKEATLWWQDPGVTSGSSLGGLKVENPWSKQLLFDLLKHLPTGRDPHLCYYNSASIHLQALHVVNHPLCLFPVKRVAGSFSA